MTILTCLPVPQLPSYCPPQYTYPSINIRTVSLGPKITWKETQDHSKWGVTISGNIACIGDINRQAGQRKRGGGTYCTDDRNLWSAFNAVIADKDSCN